MIELASIIYLSYALYRRDWSLYEFDEPIVMWVEPKEDRKWIYKNTNSFERFYLSFMGLSDRANETSQSLDKIAEKMAESYNDKH